MRVLLVLLLGSLLVSGCAVTYEDCYSRYGRQLTDTLWVTKTVELPRAQVGVVISDSEYAALLRGDVITRRSGRATVTVTPLIDSVGGDGQGTAKPLGTGSLDTSFVPATRSGGKGRGNPPEHFRPRLQVECDCDSAIIYISTPCPPTHQWQPPASEPKPEQPRGFFGRMRAALAQGWEWYKDFAAWALLVLVGSTLIRFLILKRFTL